MLNINRVTVNNFENAIRGMRNPKKSWNKSDSSFEFVESLEYGRTDIKGIMEKIPKFKFGKNDWELAIKLVKAGSDHRKFLRQIHVSMDIKAPLYWWKQFSTYKVGTVANSTSTMHCLMNETLNMDNFAWERVTPFRRTAIEHINRRIEGYKSIDDEEEKKRIFRKVIQDLPQSFIYLRTVTLNYEVLRNMYHSRKNHKLKEWHEFCEQIEQLPYSQLITVKEN